MRQSLLDLFETQPPGQWESAYASADPAVPVGDLKAGIAAGSNAASWLAQRRQVGPHGTALPAPMEAIQRIVACQGDLADAFVVLSSVPAIPPDPMLHRLVQNAALGAVRDRWGPISAGFAAAAAVACLTAGDRERAAYWFDLDQRSGGVPHFDAIRPLRNLTVGGGLPDSIWLRRAAWAVWPRVAPPSVPTLAEPTGEGNEADRRELMRLLDGPAYTTLRPLVVEALEEWTAWVAGSLRDHPFIVAVGGAARRREERPPTGTIPTGLLEWTLHAHRRGDHPAARLGALALLSQPEPSPDLWMYVVFDIRAADAALILSQAPAELCELLAELASVTDALPVGLRDPVARAMVPLTTAQPRDAELLRAALPALSALTGSDRPALSALVSELCAPSGLTDSATATTLRRAIAGVQDRVGPLTDAHHEALAAAILEAPALPDRAGAAMATISDLEQELIGALLLRRGADRHRRAALSRAAAEVLGQIDCVGLLPLREELLLDGISSPESPAQLAWCLKALANTRLALAESEPVLLRQCLEVFFQGVQLAAKIGEHTIFAECVVGLCRTLIRGLLHEPEGRRLAARVRELSAQALNSDIDPELRATVQWAEASLLLELTGVDQGPLLEQAIALLEAAAAGERRLPLLVDIPRTMSLALSRAGRKQQSIAVATHALEHAPHDLPACERGYLHGNLAERLMEAHDIVAARHHFREALRLLPDDFDAAQLHISYALLEVHHGEPSQARAVLDRLLRQRWTLPRDLVHQASSRDPELGKKVLVIDLPPVRFRIDRVVVGDVVHHPGP